MTFGFGRNVRLLDDPLLFAEPLTLTVWNSPRTASRSSGDETVPAVLKFAVTTGGISWGEWGVCLLSFVTKEGKSNRQNATWGAQSHASSLGEVTDPASISLSSGRYKSTFKSTTTTITNNRTSFYSSIIYGLDRVSAQLASFPPVCEGKSSNMTITLFASTPPTSPFSQ